MRVFAAVRPPGVVLEHLGRALSAVGATPAGTGELGPVRWTVPENWHLTAAFYGEVPDGALDDLGSALAATASAASPFELCLRGAGVFSHRTLWVGAGGDVDAMVRLSAEARDAGAGVTSWQDERVRSRPHLTVGRVGARRGTHRSRAPRTDPAVTALVQALAVYESPGWTVTDLLLVESRPGEGRGGGPLYTEIARYGLGAGRH